MTRGMAGMRLENFAYLFNDNEILFLADLDINFLQEDIYVSNFYDDTQKPI